MKYTEEQMRDLRDYEIELANHHNWYDTKLRDMETILAMVEKHTELKKPERFLPK